MQHVDVYMLGLMQSGPHRTHLTEAIGLLLRWHAIYVLFSCLGGYKLLDANYVYYA